MKGWKDLNALERETILLLSAIRTDILNFLKGSPIKYPFYTNAYRIKAPKRSGLYFVWESNELVYVGESGALDLRMQDIANDKHPLRKQLKNQLFIPTRQFRVAFYPFKLGRIEMEELLTSETEASRSGRKVPKYNRKRGNRRYK